MWLYHRFALSFRDVEDVLARRGVDVTYEAIRKWCRRFGPEYAGRLRRRRGRLGDTWHLDEVFVTLQGRQQYLWRAVDEDGDVLDILVQPRRNRHAAVRFFRKLLKNQRHVPRRLITDKLRSYSAACRAVMPSVFHCTDQYANNRAEVSHQEVKVAGDEGALRDDPHGVAERGKHGQAPARELEPALDRLIRIGHPTHREHLGRPRAARQLSPQEFRRARLDEDPRLEIEPGR